ncbi:MAG: 30S ribosomal protein S20 [candidate division WOR-3 bacterium]|nr:30S ribosomal protein S20 [candidate division WOR-3 bacterium]MDW8151112.1 30S ribosomal protein S20 [candidate division WOR-3 bacterium]
MPKVKLSVKKRERQNKKRRLRNLLYKMKIKSVIRKFLKAKNLEEKREILKEVYEYVDKAVKKGVIHRNKASRIKSKYAKLCLEKQSKEV